MHIELRIDGITAVDEELDLRALIDLLEEADEDGFWWSAPLTFRQAKDLLSRVDTRTLELIRQIVLRGGSITWPHVGRIFGIGPSNWLELHAEWLMPLNQLAGAVSRETNQNRKLRWLIRWDQITPEREANNLRDVKYEIGDADLQSLRKALLG